MPEMHSAWRLCGTFDFCRRWTLMHTAQPLAATKNRQRMRPSLEPHGRSACAARLGGVPERWIHEVGGAARFHTEGHRECTESHRELVSPFIGPCCLGEASGAPGVKSCLLPAARRCPECLARGEPFVRASCPECHNAQVRTHSLRAVNRHASRRDGSAAIRVFCAHRLSASALP